MGIEEMNMRFAGNVVQVAGGTGGLGKPMSLAFLNEDSEFAVTYRKQEEIPALHGAGA